MAALKQFIEERLKPGYRLVRQTGNTYYVLTPYATYVRSPSGRVISIIDLDENYIHRTLIVRELREAGAAYKAKELRSGVPGVPGDQVGREERESTKGRKSGLVVSQEILGDASATPRERALARAYMDLQERHDRVRYLATKLARALDERG